MKTRNTGSLITFLKKKRRFNFSSSQTDLGNLCQNIWNSARNNLKVGKEIVVCSGGMAKPLITLTKQGKAKVQRSVFVKFQGEFLEDTSLF